MNVNSIDLKDEWLSVALDAADAASRALLSRFRPPTGSPLELNYKGPSDVVTDADLASDQAIAEVLSQSGLPGNILSEESKTDRDDSQFAWLVDPLCGTLPFSTGLPHWGICIALSSATDLLVGVVSLPTTGEVISAVKGQGSYLNGNNLQSQEPPGELSDIGVAIEGNNQRFTSSQRILQRAPGRTYAFESAAYPIGQVLLGRLHGVAGLKGLSVHSAAGVVIARELGVCVTDEAGGEVVWDPDGAENGLIVAWPRTHQALLRALTERLEPSQ